MEEILTNFRRNRLFSIQSLDADDPNSMRSRAATMSAAAGAQVDHGIKVLKELSIIVLETALRLPGLILMELWWRNLDLSFEDISQEMLKKAPFNSYLDITTVLDFVHRRNFDNSAAIILNYSVILISLMFLTLPLNRLFRMYSHSMSIAVFAFAHYMSFTYVQLEIDAGDEDIKLDDFVKLERHGFHFLAQMLLALCQSLLLELESEHWRVFLAMFCIPIVSRMCGCPLDKLMLTHNIACGLVMIFVCFYMLYRLPNLIKAIRVAFRQIKAIFVIRGLAMGSVTVWRRLRIAELMAFTWITIFSSRLYVEMIEKGRPWWEAGPVLLAGVAESTNTPISLLALAITVSFFCKWVADAAQLVVGGQRDHGHVLAHSGYTEAFTLVVLCAQTGLLGMKTDQKAFLLGLVLFIVMSALLQSLYELLEPQLLNLASNHSSTRGRHIRCLALAVFLMIAPAAMCKTILTFLPFDLWCTIIISNCSLTSVHAISITAQYVIAMIDSKSEEPWEGSDNFTFYVNCGTRVTELLIAKIVLIYGCIKIVHDGLTFSTIAILLFHVIVNIYKRIEHLVLVIRSRSEACKNIDRLSKANAKQLKEREDVCAICFIEMREEARITPCNHYFHGPCLRKWLAVKLVCPLCYSEMKVDDEKAKDSVTTTTAAAAAAAENAPQADVNRRPVNGEMYFDWDDMFSSFAHIPGMERGRRNRDEQRLHEARDMWPLLMDNQAYESDSSTTSEFTIADEAR
ncbi:unnamed protein product [Caenorhabditis bovis]|uniref:RING-type domain-containing protein n=1 Tax=Caenorhabditis bovis TaxID=2654633 RepID=A0A8S1F5G2_9PELO|nr:unnamed protein product [Caenorhabditis bovis]